VPRRDCLAPKAPRAESYRGLELGAGDGGVARAGDGAPVAGLDGAAEGEPVCGERCAVAGAEGTATGTVAASVTRELAAAGAAETRFACLPWLGTTVSTSAAVAAARTRNVTAPASTPVRKLTSSSRALTAARIPGHEPAVR
jgi:hypothetical protein